MFRVIIGVLLFVKVYCLSWGWLFVGFEVY